MLSEAVGHAYLTLSFSLLIAGGMPACGDGILEVGDEWTAMVRTTTTGEDLDTDGYVVVPDKGSRVRIQTPNDRAILKLEEGDHMLELTDVAENCTVQGDNPVAVTTAKGKVASVSFHIYCEAMEHGQRHNSSKREQSDRVP